MHPASLPGGAKHHRGDRLFEPGVGIGDHQLGAGQAAGLQRPQECRPERPVLAVADGEPEDLTATVRGDTGGDHDRLGHHPGPLAALATTGATDPGLAVGRIEEHVRELLVGQIPIGERCDLLVQVGADPRHLRLADPGLGTQRLNQVVDLPHARTGHIRLHDHREQGLVDPPPPLQQTREERPGAELGDRQVQVAGRSGDRLGPGAVALGDPSGAALMGLSTNQRRSLGVDQLLQHHLQRVTNHLGGVGGLQRIEHLEQGRLRQGHRVVLLRKILGRFFRSLTRWLLNVREPDRELHHHGGRHPCRPDLVPLAGFFRPPDHARSS